MTGKTFHRNSSRRLVGTPTCCRVLRNRCGVALSPSSLRLTLLMPTRHGAGFGDSSLSKVILTLNFFFWVLHHFNHLRWIHFQWTSSFSHPSEYQATCQNHSGISTRSLDRDVDHQLVLFCISSHFTTAASQFKSHSHLYLFWFSVNTRLKVRGKFGGKRRTTCSHIVQCFGCFWVATKHFAVAFSSLSCWLKSHPVLLRQVI